MLQVGARAADTVHRDDFKIDKSDRSRWSMAEIAAYLSLQSVFFFFFFGSLLLFVLTLTLTQIPPPLLQRPGAWNRLASMWMSDSVTLKRRLLDRHWLTRREGVARREELSFKYLLMGINCDSSWVCAELGFRFASWTREIAHVEASSGVKHWLSDTHSLRKHHFLVWFLH